MIVEKVCEYFLGDEKGGVPAVKLMSSFRQGLRDLDQARQAGVLGAPFAACGWVWPLHRPVKDGKKGRRPGAGATHGDKRGFREMA
jgi:hypothetical protein